MFYISFTYVLHIFYICFTYLYTGYKNNPFAIKKFARLSKQDRHKIKQWIQENVNQPNKACNEENPLILTDDNLHKLIAIDLKQKFSKRFIIKHINKQCFCINKFGFCINIYIQNNTITYKTVQYQMIINKTNKKRKKKILLLLYKEVKK